MAPGRSFPCDLVVDSVSRSSGLPLERTGLTGVRPEERDFAHLPRLPSRFSTVPRSGADARLTTDVDRSRGVHSGVCYLADLRSSPGRVILIAMDAGLAIVTFA